MRRTFSPPPAWVVTSGGLLAVLLLGIADYVTGPEIAWSVFYLVPIGTVAWLAGRVPGTMVALFAAVVWLMADMALVTYSHPAIPYWNFLTRLTVFFVVVFALSGLKAAREGQQELLQFIIHDLRSPLNGIILGLSALRQRPDTFAAGQEVLDRTLRSAESMGELIHSLMDVARLESGRFPIEPRATNLSELIKSATEEVALWAQEEGVCLQVEGTTTKCVARIDPRLIRRVLVNLLGNAIKFSPHGSAVTIRVDAEGASRLVVRILDEGSGIPREWASHVFDKFVQLEHRGAGGAAGAGLGLPFCRLAVEAQGGRIWVEPRPEGGTSIAFSIPAERSATVD